MNAKSFIISKLQSFLGIDALLIRIETDDTLIASLRNQVKDLEAEIGHVSEKMLVPDIEDFITERDLGRAIEEAIDNQDWDSIVSDALSERHISRAIEEAIKEYDRNTTTAPKTSRTRLPLQ